MHELMIKCAALQSIVLIIVLIKAFWCEAVLTRRENVITSDRQGSQLQVW